MLKAIVSKGKLTTTIPYIFLLLFLFFSFFIYCINSKTPLVGEDLILSPWKYQSVPSSFDDMFEAVQNRVVVQASNWNSRIGELASIVLGAFDKSVFNVLNTILINLLIIILFALANGRFPNVYSSTDAISIFIIMFLCICLHPVLGEIFFWKSGTTNHTWGIILLLSFLLPFRLFIFSEVKQNYAKIRILLHSILGLIAGFASEGSNIAVITIILFLIFYAINQKQNDLKKYYFPFVTFFFSTLTFLTSPSTYIRRHYYEKLNLYDKNLGIMEYYFRGQNILRDYVKYTWIILLLFIFLIIHYYFTHKKNIKEIFLRKEIYSWLNKETFIFFIIALSYISILVLISIPYQSDQKRGFAFNWYLLFSGIAFLYASIWKDTKKRIYRFYYLIFPGILLIGTIIVVSIQYSDFSNFVTQRNNSINMQLDKNNNAIFVQPLPIHSNRFLETRENYFLGNLDSLIKDYYQVNSIILENTAIEPMKYTFSDGMKINIEKIDQDKEKINIYGWALIENINSNKYNIYLVLKSDDAEFFYSTNLIKRKDVSNHFSGNYDYSGFSVYLWDNNFIEGEYKIGIIISTRDGTFGTLSDKTISMGD